MKNNRSMAIKGLLMLACLVTAPIVMAYELAYLAYTEGYWQVWLYDSEEGKAKQLSFSQYDKNVISWYPDRRALLINGAQGQLMQLEVKTGSEEHISLPTAGFFDAVLSPDGKRITFSYSATGEADDSAIWTIDLSTKAMTKHSNLVGLQHSPRWSPDGTSIYFVSSAPDTSNGLWKTDLSANALVQLTFNPDKNFDVVPISAMQQPQDQGGTTLADHYLYSSNKTGDYEIWLQRPGAAAKNISSRPGLDQQPVMSVDGANVAFVSTGPEGVSQIWLYEMSSGRAVQLTHHVDGARYPMWR